jgi:hypothetical protein
MTTVAKNILNTYSKLFEGLDIDSKKELMGRLSKSLSKPDTSKERAFYQSFGAFPDDKPAGQIAEEIKASRAFRKRDIHF